MLISFITFQNFKYFADQLWRITEDNKLVNKNGHWTYENLTLTIPKEGSEGYIQNNRGKIIIFFFEIESSQNETFYFNEIMCVFLALFKFELLK